MRFLAALVPTLLLLAVVGSAAATGACISDPPPATTCPPPEPPTKSCGQALQSPTPQGCAPTVYQTCLRPSCDCPASECAPNPAACWPGGECPPALVAQTGAGTSCLRLDADSSPSSSTCQCGCPRCVSECDGHAVPLAAFVAPVPNGQPVPFFQFVLPKNVPAKGRLGLYARIRGELAGAIALAVTRGGLAEKVFPIGTLQSTYADTILGATDGVSWQTIDTAPDGVILLLLPGTRVAAEIDCIVPFVEPL